MNDIVPIIRANIGRHSVRAALPYFVALVIAVLVLGLAAPRLAAAVLAWDAVDIVRAQRSGTPHDNATLLQSAAQLEQSASIADDPKLQLDAAYLYLLVSRRGGDEAAAHRQIGHELIITGLGGMVGQPHAWWLLASLNAAAGQPQVAKQSLRLSYLTGRVVPELMGNRLRLGFVLLPTLDLEGREYLLRDIRNGWILDVTTVLGAVQGDLQAALVASVIAGLSNEERSQFLRVRGLPR